jgi:hypothetical protein
MWVRAKQALGSLAMALALFICLRVSRVFLAGDIVGAFMPLTGRAAIVWVALVAGALPSLPLGLAYGLLRARNVLAGAMAVAVLACAFELTTSSVVSWWRFVTWWVLPLECVTALLVFATAALFGSRLPQPMVPVARFRLGVGVFLLITVSAIAWLAFLQLRSP